MNIKVTIEYTDEWNMDILGVSGISNIDLVDETHIEAIGNHIKQALLACGFHQNSIDKLFNEEIE